MRALNTKPQIRNRVLFFQSFERPRILENDFQLGAGHHALPIDDETCGWRTFNEPLQTIPAALRNFSQLLDRVQNKIDNHKGKIAVAQKEIARFDGVEG